MMKLLLSYFDQNEEFAKSLPRRCSVDRVVRSSRDDEWTMVRLDEPVDHGNRVYHHLLLRSRWHGLPIGGEEATSVHIVLVRSDDLLCDGFVIGSKDHVAWGMAERIEE